jgi:hypothetical protein
LKKNGHHEQHNRNRIARRVQNFLVDVLFPFCDLQKQKQKGLTLSRIQTIANATAGMAHAFKRSRPRAVKHNKCANSLPIINARHVAVSLLPCYVPKLKKS